VLETFTLTLFSTITLLLGDIHVRLSKCVEYTCLKKNMNLELYLK